VTIKSRSKSKEATMDLILWRHADAELARADQSDLDRALTEKGERQAARVAKWLNGVLPAGTRIIASPAKRAQQTAQALGREFETVAGIATDVSADQLLRAAGWPHAREAVLVIGHQPTLGEAAARVLAGAPQPLAIKKGAVWWLRSGDEGVLLVTVRSPDDV
jgi:phosphohistidine phosphatase